MTPSPQAAYASYPSLRGRVVVVTGGASGIGEKIVEEFARQGAKVAFLDIQNDAGTQLAQRISAEGDPAPEFLQCDLTDIDALQKCMQAIITKFGTIDVLINNAANDARHVTEEVTPEYWDRTIAVNLKHQFFASQAVIPAMKKAGRGSIINVSSISWMIPGGWVLGIHHGQGRDCRTHSYPGARIRGEQYPRELCSTWRHSDRTTKDAVVHGRLHGRDLQAPSPEAYHHARRGSSAPAFSGRR
jgi:NAD(P)-dependent dehydrogenase (short-subunit alcohol dehydrogenase family)